MEDTEKTMIRPELCAWYDEENNRYDIDVELPGVKKEDIELKVVTGAFMLDAKKGDVVYHGDYSFCCPVNVDKTSAVYDNGLLNILVPLKEPFADARKIEIQ